MARTGGTLPAPRDRRRAAHVRGKHPVEETHPSADTTTYTIVDSADDPEQQKKATFLEVCWPALFGIFLALIAERMRLAVDEQLGAVGDRLIFPFVQIVSRPELGLGDTSGGLAQLMLYLQFPLTGLYASWNLSRGRKLFTTILQIGFTYGIIAFVLWLLTAPGASHGL